MNKNVLFSVQKLIKVFPSQLQSFNISELFEIETWKLKYKIEYMNLIESAGNPAVNLIVLDHTEEVIFKSRCPPFEQSIQFPDGQWFKLGKLSTFKVRRWPFLARTHYHLWTIMGWQAFVEVLFV